MKLYNADCLDIMKTMPDKSVDLVLTDPPYGIKRDKGFGGFGGFGKPIARRNYVDGDWDKTKPEKKYFDEILRIGKKVFIFGGQFFTEFLPQNNHWIVWDKLNTMPSFGDCELVWTNINRNSVKKYTVLWNGLIGKEEARFHPTQKPLRILSYILRDYSTEQETIFDPYMGVGSTGVTCKESNRNFIGVELNKKYFDIAKRRIECTTESLF